MAAANIYGTAGGWMGDDLVCDTVTFLLDSFQHTQSLTDMRACLCVSSSAQVTDTGVPVKNQRKMSVQVLTCSLDW